MAPKTKVELFAAIRREQARQAGKFTPVHDAWWAAARRAHGDAEGTRALIEVLLLHRTMAHEHAVAGIATALKVGALTSDVVAVEARKAAQIDPQPAAAAERLPARNSGLRSRRRSPP